MKGGLCYGVAFYIIWHFQKYVALGDSKRRQFRLFLYLMQRTHMGDLAPPRHGSLSPIATFSFDVPVITLCIVVSAMAFCSRNYATSDHFFL